MFLFKILGRVTETRGERNCGGREALQSEALRHQGRTQGEGHQEFGDNNLLKLEDGSATSKERQKKNQRELKKKEAEQVAIDGVKVFKHLVIAVEFLSHIISI